MNAPVRFAYANARMRALKSELWDEAQAARIVAAPASCTPPPSDDNAVLYPPLVRWYATLLRACPPATRVMRALLLRHEIENLKLLWRCAVRHRAVPARCWRPLAPLAALEPTRTVASLPALVEQLSGTPYAQLAARTLRSHGEDLLAAELAFDAWALARVHDAALSLPERESSARDLLFMLIRERDIDLLRRGREAYLLDPTLVAGLTTLLRHEQRRDALVAAAQWDLEDRSIPPLVPREMRGRIASAHGWDEVMAALRRTRAAECRRLLLGNPFRMAPFVAALLLREDQLRLLASLAVRRRGGPETVDAAGAERAA